MRYLGNKTKLLEHIEDFIVRHDIQGEVFADLFAGTGSVGDHFKSKYKILSNDFMYYSYVINMAKLKNETVPSFEVFHNEINMNIFEWLNTRKYESNTHYFIYENYSPKGERMFFTEENAIKIDGIRIAIEDLYRTEKVSQNEYFYLLASLLESVNKVSNTSGTYEAFFKFWESRAIKRFELHPISINQVELFSKENEVFNMNSNNLIKSISGDIVYIDTPYTVTQYSSAYHMLETIARYDSPYIKGVGGKRPKGDCVSLYSRKNEAKSEFEDLLRKLQFKEVIISYSNQSIIDIDDFVDIVRKFAVSNNVIVEEIDYQQYKNHRGKSRTKKLKEYLIYFKKDAEFVKSPLNYSGSKDRIIRNIINELPKKVDCFVDAMGGAFNVGINVYANQFVHYNEINSNIVEIVKWLVEDRKQEVLQEVNKIISDFEMEKGNKTSYLNLRRSYNEEPTKSKLYVLHMYAFQNMLRFNSKKKMNTPVGVAGYSKDIEKRICTFFPRTQEVRFSSLDYTKIDFSSFPEDTLFYFDPPYFITSAAYNDGKRGYKGWSAEEEVELLNILLKLDKMSYKFILSNVIKHKDRTNYILKDWVKEHDFSLIHVGTTGWRYQKDEVLIKNF